MTRTAKPGQDATRKSVHIALLRGINVGGNNMIAMAKLRDLFAELGCTGVKTLLQSGNVVFENPRSTGAELERRLEAETAKRFGVSVDYVVRSAGEWAKIVDCQAEQFHQDQTTLVRNGSTRSCNNCIWFCKNPSNAN